MAPAGRDRQRVTATHHCGLTAPHEWVRSVRSMPRREFGFGVCALFLTAHCALDRPAASAGHFVGCYSVTWDGEALGVFDSPLVTALELTSADRDDDRGVYAARARYQHVVGGAEPGQTVDLWPFTVTVARPRPRRRSACD